MKGIISLLITICGFVSCQSQSKIIVVAHDGSGNFLTVQAAFNSIPKHNKRAVTVFIKDGIYKEKLHLDSTKDFVTIMGEDEFKTILTNDDHTGKVKREGDTVNTRNSYSFVVYGNNFTAKNITIQNNAGFTAGQAVALESDGDKEQYFNCRLLGFQDILFTNNPDSRQFYEDCYIEGTTDFIFGSATVWFEHCHIHSKKNSHVTAASTPQDHEFGYVFNDCTFTGDTSLHKVSLGRPWRAYAAVTYIHCFLGPQIKPEGFSNWNNTDNYKTARYAEYEDYGPGADKSERVSWEKQLNDNEVKKYTIENVLGGWMPDQFE
ncbi:MAG: pectin esterase [Bacteroidota bacterium]|nr:pectin esterase [Bacteroidota bacterium]